MISDAGKKDWLRIKKMCKMNNISVYDLSKRIGYSYQGLYQAILLQRIPFKRKMLLESVIQGNSEFEQVLVVGIHPACFRAGESAEIISLKYIMPHNQFEYRLCVVILFGDGTTDYFPLSELNSHYIPYIKGQPIPEMLDITKEAI